MPPLFVSRHIGDCYWNLNRVEDALKSHHNYLSLSENLSHPLETQRALTTLGGTYFNRAMLILAESPELGKHCLVESLRLFERALGAIKFLTDVDCPQAERTEMKIICYRMLSDQMYLLHNSAKGIENHDL